MSETNSPLSFVDDQTLPPVLGGQISETEPLRHNSGNAASGGIWRVSGPDGAAVFKLARPPVTESVGSPSRQTSDDPGHWNYWKREYLAYAEGLAGSAYADAGIVPPRLLSVDHRPDGWIGLWLSYEAGLNGTQWPAERITAFARQLGQGQARWAGRPLKQAWLSRDWLRQYLAGRPSPTELNWVHPVACIWPAPVRQSLATLWERREEVLSTAEKSEQTLAHLDVWPANLVATDAATVLLDWSFVGRGALGEDPSNLIFDTFADGLVDPALLPEVADGVTEGYLAGLRDGGWTGSPDQIRRAIAACGAAKYCWFAPALVSRVSRGGSVGSRDYGQHDSAEEMFTGLTGLMTLLADWAETALG